MADAIMCAGAAIVLRQAVVFSKVEWEFAQSPVAFLLIFFFIQYLLVKYYRVFLYPRYFSPLRHLPGPKACNSLNSWKEVLQTNCYKFHKPSRWCRMLKEITGKGIIILEAAEHRQHRIMLAAVFSANNVRKLEPIFRAKSEEMCDVIEASIRADGNGNVENAGIVDCTELFNKVTLDIIGVTVLGVELAYLKSVTVGGNGGAQCEKGRKEKEYGFHDAYEVIWSQSLFGKILFFANAFVPTRWIPVRENRDFAYATTWLQQVLTQLIRKRYEIVQKQTVSKTSDREETATTTTTNRDLLSIVIEERMPGGPAEGIKEENLLGHLLQFMVTGHSTNADNLSWSAYILSIHQDIQDKLHNEIHQLTSGRPKPDFAEIDALPYLRNFVNETLRMYAPCMHREAGEDLTIDGVFIPKGTTFDIVPAMSMLNPSIWGDDAETFDPTRWDRLNALQQSPYAFEAFSNGPRMCIGKGFALMEIKIILVELVQRFHFVKVDKPFTIENPGFAMRPNGMQVQLIPW
ncbi:cytochrome P450 [Xylariales sp. PMI_506]|nr:cytochrome P450 [Xylariales sp. PMI_506]